MWSLLSSFNCGISQFSNMFHGLMNNPVYITHTHICVPVVNCHCDENINFGHHHCKYCLCTQFVSCPLCGITSITFEMQSSCNSAAKGAGILGCDGDSFRCQHSCLLYCSAHGILTCQVWHVANSKHLPCIAFSPLRPGNIKTLNLRDLNSSLF